MADKTRNSVLAIKVESTEGTPVLPTAGSDFIAQQGGFSFEPGFETLENPEIRASIGKSKPITGLENPKASFSHFVRHSGVEGQAPNFGLLLKAAFGSQSIAGTQYDTVAGSTASAINVDTGEGSQFSRGQPLLVKDATNGYSIRPVHSIAGDVLTPGFNLPGAPAALTQLGKAVLYAPVSDGHPSLTLWEYRGNAGAVEMISGARVTEFSMSVQAGQLINGSFSLEGVKYFFNPIEITANTKDLDFTDDATARVASVTAKVYRDPHELAQAVQDSMNALGSSNTFSVVYDSSGADKGKFTITSDGSTLSLDWATGANAATSIGSKLGFDTSSDDSAALTYTSDDAQSWAAAQTPSYDDADPLVAKANEVLLGDADDTTTFKASQLDFKLSNTKANIPDVSADSGISGSVINARDVSIDIVGLMERHDAEKFKRYRANDTTRFLFNFGVKSGGNWVAGKCVSLYLPSATISSFKLGDGDGLVTVEMTMTAFVDSDGNGEVYLGCV